MKIISQKVKEAVKDMTSLMEQRIASMETKLKVFEEEIQRIIDIKVSNAQKILEKFIVDSLASTEKSIDNRYLPRIEELEKQLRMMMDAFQSYRDKNELDL